ncbi:hypothetical protein [Amycolatopsis methanolica]|uniref:hypothetical protein n=1 Tax=Amycolatopsis methanolica TaxID=1814 RepID=UPI00341ECF13
MSRQLAPVLAAVIPAAAAVLLTGKPSPGCLPRGRSSARSRGEEADEQGSAADGAEQPAPAQGRGRGVGGDEPGVVGRLGHGVFARGGQFAAQGAGPQRAHHGGEFERDVRDERGEEDPRADVVPGVEAEPEDVVVLDVEDPGGELEQGAADQEEQRDPFQRVGERADR